MRLQEIKEIGLIHNDLISICFEENGTPFPFVFVTLVEKIRFNTLFFGKKQLTNPPYIVVAEGKDKFSYKNIQELRTEQIYSLQRYRKKELVS